LAHHNPFRRMQTVPLLTFSVSGKINTSSCGGPGCNLSGARRFLPSSLAFVLR
jgi:hypothetical protein